MERRDKHNYYLDISEAVLKRGSCMRRNFGAVIVKHEQIISSGYTGAPRGRKNCIDIEKCTREDLGIPRGERYEMCRSVHAEANAIIHASRNDMLDSTLYLTGKEVKTGEYVKNTAPCAMCKRLIINSGIYQVVARINNNEFFITDTSFWIENDESFTGIFGY